MTTGIMHVELLGLKWADVNQENATVRVRRTLTRKGTGYALGEPKTKKSQCTVRLTLVRTPFSGQHLLLQL